MNRFGLIILVFSLIFCSCNKDNEPDLEIELPISLEFVPVSIEIDKNDLDQNEREEILKLVNNQHVINNIWEIPIDPVGQNDAFRQINFEEYTLLIKYHFKSWPIETYSNRFYRNTKENSYNWLVRLGTINENYDTNIIQFIRFAIVVKKLPPGSNVQTWYSVQSL